MSSPALVAPLVTAACIHCGLAIPTGRSSDYCCTGCEVVATAIREHGLDEFYALRSTPAPAHITAREYSELDDPAFARLHVRTDPAGHSTSALYLEDLRCGACAWLVEAAPRCIPGLVSVRVDLGRGRADVTWDDGACKLSAIARHFDRLGHAVHAYRGLDRDKQRRREDRALLLRMGVAGAAMGNLMLLAIALYAGLFGGMSAADTTVFRWASMLVAVPGLGFAATPFFTTALGSLRARRLHLDLPLSIGIIAGLAWGSANVIRGVGEIYFDSLSMLTFLLLVSRWIVLRHQRRASSAAELLLALTPSRARRIEAQGARDVPIDALVPGDLVEVRVGETIPVDGILATGRSAIDAGLLSGESRPVDVEPGMAVHAGTVNVASVIEVRVTAVGEATRVGALVAGIETLSQRKAPIERYVDRIAGRFVFVVTTVAALTLIGWSIARSAGAGMEQAMALLVVTCPCALALATPLAVTVALGRAARQGILVKGADALERLASAGTMFVDKTGTLTQGQISVVSWQGSRSAIELAAAIEAGSNHPIARALVAHAGIHPVADEAREELGFGAAGRVGYYRVVVGAPAWVRQRARLGADADAWIAGAVARGETPIAIAVDDFVVAVAGLSDAVRPDARAAIDALRALGWDVSILSGDVQGVVERVGAELGVPTDHCEGGASPEDKLARIKAARERGAVVMVGDGVNDAAAMTAATCGIAVSGAAEIAIEAADVYLREPSITAIADTVAGARATLATIRRSLRFSLVYNVIAGALAVSGLIHPLLAALAMPASSLAVLANSLRSRAFRRSP